MDDYSLFIDNKIPYLFRYKYSNPDTIRTVIISKYDKEKDIIIAIEEGVVKAFKVSGIHFETSDILNIKYDQNDDQDEEYNYNNKYKVPINRDKKAILKEAINNNITIAFKHEEDIYVLEPYKIFEYGKSILFYDKNTDDFISFRIDEIEFI
jgi:hypothetical protein